MKNKLNIITETFTLIFIWIAVNWFKVLIGVVLLSLVFIYHGYSQANAQQTCAQYGTGLDEKLSQQLEKNNPSENTAYDESVPRMEEHLNRGSNYQFRNGICYRGYTIESYYSYDGGDATTTSRYEATHYNLITSYIENAYTQEQLSACELKDGISTDNVSCQKYYKDFDKFFYNLYGI